MPDALFSDVCWILRTLREQGYPAYIVGGAVRDILLGRIPEDYDIATTAPPDTITALFPRTKPVGRAFGTILVIVEHRPYQITTLQSRDGSFTESMEKDILRRDFTVNALFWNPIEDRMIDIVGGMRDLKRRILRPVTTAEKIYRNDPVRMLRAFRIAPALGFSLDPSLGSATRTLRGEIQRVAPERIHAELVKILSLPHVLAALCPLVTTRLLFEIIPELWPLRHLKQSPFHDFSALSHTFRVLNAAEGLLETPLFRPILSTTGKHVLMMAALLHDIGKPETHSMKNGANHFYGHEKTGAALARDILRRLRFPRKDATLITNLVARHLYPLHLFRHYRDHTLTRRAVERFLRKTKRYRLPLLLLSSADQLAKRRRSTGNLDDTWISFLNLLLSKNGQKPGNKTDVAQPSS